MIPVECIVRGYITGSGWESYQKNGTVCGITLPAGLKESQKLAEPIFTPSTKAELGDHDENISEAQCVEYLEKRFPGKGAEYTKAIKEATIAHFIKNVLIMPTRRASSLPIPNLNLVWMKTARLYWVTK